MNNSDKIIIELKKNKASALCNNLLSENELREAYLNSIHDRGIVNNNPRNNNNIGNYKTSFIYCISIVLGIFIATPFANHFWEYFIGIRCLVPNNYLVWEATRPVSDCSFCDGIRRPLILPNLTQAEFAVSYIILYLL